MNDPKKPQYSASSSQPSELRSNSVPPRSRFMSAPGRLRTGSGSDCPYPVNFRQTKGEAHQDGSLYFEYEWDSSTGNLRDLSSCTVGEIVEYPGDKNPYEPPNPPFTEKYNNPTVLNLDATWGQMADTHYCSTFSAPPYESASFDADQTYRYHNQCMSSAGSYLPLKGASYDQ